MAASGDALTARRRLADGETMRLQRDAQELADLRLVVDDKDGWSRSCLERRRRGRLPGGPEPAVRQRQVDLDARADAVVTGNARDRPAVRLEICRG